MASVLLVEPFLGGSHRAWAEGWVRHSRHEITLLGHEGRHWRWRMRGSAVSLAREARDRGAAGSVDVVVASNMLDLAAFRGLVGLDARWVQYLHENQLTYPRQRGEPVDTGLAWMQWRGLVAADEVWINSRFHRDALFAALDGFLTSAPDHDHEPERAELPARVRVISPGVDIAACRAGERSIGSRPLVLSNQRWHHDKDVGAVLRTLLRMAGEGLEFDVAVVGDSDGGEAVTLDPLLDALGERVVARGLLPRAAYLEVLRHADIVVSAARGENFGIAVVEAIAAGAWPVLPDALAYPEVVPPVFHDATLYPPGGLGRHLRSTVAAVASGSPAVAGLDLEMAVFDERSVAAEMDDHIDRLLGV